MSNSTSPTSPYDGRPLFNGCCINYSEYTIVDWDVKIFTFTAERPLQGKRFL